MTRDAQGHQQTWRVTGRRQYDKADLPREIFLPDREHRLRLITCASREVTSGDRFHYQDNLVITLDRANE